MAEHTPSSIFFSVIGILVSGICGGLAGWSVVTALEWGGVGGALVAAVIGMVIATAVWTGITVVLRAAGLVQ